MSTKGPTALPQPAPSSFGGTLIHPVKRLRVMPAANAQNVPHPEQAALLLH
jgi:hypothetical protein